MHEDMEQECGQGHIAWVENESESAKKEGKKTKSGREGGRKDRDSSGSKTNATNNTQMRRADEKRDGSISGTKELSMKRPLSKCL